MKHAAVIPAILAALALAHVAAFAADTDDIPEMPVMSAVVAEVNGVVITFGDLWEEVEVPVRELRKTYHGRDLQRRINMLLVTQLERKKNGILLLTEAESLLTDQVSMQLHERVAKRIRTLVHEAGSMAALKDSLSQQGKDLFYRFELAEPAGLEVVLEPDFDGTVALLTGEDCDHLETVACGTDLDLPPLQPGTWYLVVEGLGAAEQGTFVMHVKLLEP